MSFRPTQDYILVRPIERTQSDVIAVVSHEKHCRGVVVSVGPGKRDKKGRLHPLDTQAGDIVAFGDGNFDFYPRYQETPEGPVFRIIQEGDVCFVAAPDVKDWDDISARSREAGDKFYQAVLNSEPEDRLGQLRQEFADAHESMVAVSSRIS